MGVITALSPVEDIDPGLYNGAVACDPYLSCLMFQPPLTGPAREDAALYGG
jgi:hypothetical protein